MPANAREGQGDYRGGFPHQPSATTHAEGPEVVPEHGRSAGAAPAPDGLCQRGVQARQATWLWRT